MPSGIYLHKKGVFKHTKEWKKMMSKRFRGRKFSTETRKKMSEWQKGKKLSEETKRKISKSKKGKPSPLKGKKKGKMKNETKEKIGIKNSILMKEKWKDEKYRKGMSEKHKGKFAEKASNWQGGKTLLGERIRNSFQYRQWRSDIFTRDNFTCQKCGVRGGNLETHHIKQFTQILKENNIKTLEQALNCEELWDINNGITLCLNCHKKYEK